jgi:hypothetical protein
MKIYLAQCVIIAGEKICGPIPTPTGAGGGGNITVADIINKLVAFIFPLSGILLFFFLVWGGYDFLLSAGNPEKLKSGQAKMTSAVIGFILLASSYLLVKLIALVFGLRGIL